MTSAVVEGIRTARTFLFVPGNRPERFARALGSGADVVVLDLEDAVPAESKDEARRSVEQFLAASHAHETGVAVRVNSIGTEHASADLEVLGSIGRAATVMVPKAEYADQVRAVSQTLPADSGLIALIETARGILGADAIAAVSSVWRLAFGHLDLCAEVGLDPDDAAALWPMRAALVLASAANALPAPIDGVTTDFRDLDRVASDAARAARSGLGAKLCIHPDQVAPIRESFLPSDDSLQWAMRVVNSLDEHSLGQIDGQMIDRPVYLRARAIAAQASAPADHASSLGES